MKLTTPTGYLKNGQFYRNKPDFFFLREISGKRQMPRMHNTKFASNIMLKVL